MKKLVLVVLALVGVGVGMLVAGRVTTTIGPFQATTSLRLDLVGDTVVRLPPLGTLRLDTHDGPFGLDIRADELRLEAAQRLFEQPAELAALERRAAADARLAVREAAVRSTIGALLGALLVVGLRELSLRSLLIAVAVTVVGLGGSAAAVKASWNDQALAEPRFSGLLTAAPSAVGSVELLQSRFTEYRDQLAKLIGNVALLYRTASTLDAFEQDDDTVRLLHVSDLHLNPQGFDLIAEISEQFNVDAVVDSGDIVDWGTSLESRYTGAIGALDTPYVYVRGNHDSPETAAAVASQPNAVVLDGTTTTVRGITIWGIGDPRFTPDKQTAGSKAQEKEEAVRFAPKVRRMIDTGSDIALVHDPSIAAELDGKVPLVLAGHLHRPIQRELGPDGSMLLVEGSTGGAGLRALEGEEPEPLVSSVLYFDSATRELIAYDRITVGGLGTSDVRIERHVVRQPPTEAPEADRFPRPL